MAELEASLSSKELTEWLAYSQLEPFGPPADEHGPALLSAIYANTHRQKDTKAFSVVDFMPSHLALEQAKKSKTDVVQENVAVMKAWFAPKVKRNVK